MRRRRAVITTKQMPWRGIPLQDSYAERHIHVVRGPHTRSAGVDKPHRERPIHFSRERRLPTVSALAYIGLQLLGLGCARTVARQSTSGLLVVYGMSVQID